jgi:hypothetical protein
MVKRADTIIMSTAELELERKAVVLETLKEVKVNLIPVTAPKRTLDIEGVMLLFKKKSRSTIQSYRNRKKNPLPMFGDPPIIEEDEALKWYREHSGDYQTE